MSAPLSRKELEDLSTSMRASQEVTESISKELACAYFRYYQHLQSAGFTKEEAFTIILKRGIA